MNELRRNIEKYIKRCKKEIDRIENVTIENPQKVYGKCAVTGEMITADQIHCHHKIPKRYGGTDAYTNLIIVSKAIHALIHATNEDVINLHKHCIKDKGMLEKLNTLRILANNKPITI